MAVSILNNETTNEEFLDFIVNEIHNAVVATTKPDGSPDAQVCDMLMHKNNKLYMTTSVNNPFFKSLTSRPEVVVDGYQGDGTMDSCGFSLRGTIKNVGHEYLDEVFEKNPYLNEIYKDDIEGAKKELRILEITPKHCGYLDHRTNPIFMRSFDF
ncbi:hypothetical protein [Lactobacillus agrestimuris]|uniref:pyridoxamine 5'-phosphate oxidase family protein n=1 Tax=Lactobacillus agrestimuris TaxID=2941328 RepID=UPI002042DD5F|nr:hypothetical protein [Lactobacillus agrestimuris]